MQYTNRDVNALMQLCISLSIHGVTTNTIVGHKASINSIEIGNTSILIRPYISQFSHSNPCLQTLILASLFPSFTNLFPSL